MPTIKSAQKRLRQERKRRERNDGYKEKSRKLLKEARSLVAENKAKEAKELLPKIYKALDKAAKKGVIKKNTASRNKARIANLIKKAK